ncbi:hypothetical protein BVG19_g2163 [[Candida] boidinii]|nr:hypothetical protein BVG19_g2163 [[Candida] boidinii]OWB53829.1 hypothetical protein B5S27_g5439 [[Candida] boidinii]OWB82221.1 hypothetical protein B5S33_g845 [[Candida] boidinii]
MNSIINKFKIFPVSLILSVLLFYSLFIIYHNFNSNFNSLNTNTTEIDNYNNNDEFDHLIYKFSKDESFKITKITDENESDLKNLGLTPNHGIILTSNSNPNKVLKYHGRFLHITDLHPDPIFEKGSSMSLACHRKIKKKKKDDDDDDDDDDIAHQYGDALSGCDSPLDLFDNTLNWIKENLKDKIDFVIWTGDNIRHDNDRKNPRLEIDILDMNQKVADNMTDLFMDKGEEDLLPLDRRIKIIPSLGNNDVYPHNLFAPGPTLQTREMYKIWRNFVPSEQMHTFDRGVYFFTEVIPGKLAVLSINTLYFFRSNPLSDNCDGRKQPGYKLFEWLGVTLKELRKRKMKVWLSGHVPPIPKNLHPSCYTKMAVWLHEYRDIIIGSLYGHMNIDHFVPLDSVKAWKSIKKRLNTKNIEFELNHLNDLASIEELSDLNDDVLALYKDLGLPIQDDEYTDDDEFFDFDTDNDNDTDNVDYKMDLKDNFKSFIKAKLSKRYENAPTGKVGYLESVRDTILSKVKGPKKYGNFGERYSFAHITSSVIPTFNPGLRVWEYNVTDLLNGNGIGSIFTPNINEFEPWQSFFDRVDLELSESDELTNSFKDLQDEEFSYSLTKDKTIPPIMPDNLKLGPGYIPQLFSPEKYTQYFVDLNKLNENLDNGKKKDTAKFEFKVQYSTDDDWYNMKSLLVEDWIKLSRKLAKSAPPKDPKKSSIDDSDDDDEIIEIETAKKLWLKYLDRAFISTGYQDMEFAQDF